MTKGKREISKLTTEVKKYGNGAHAIVPKEWIGKEVQIVPIQKMDIQPVRHPRDEVKARLKKFESHSKAIAKLARENVNYSNKE